jgi:hypothetical protein
VPVACACNPSYSGDRDQEVRGSKPELANSWRDLISKKKKITKKLGVALHQPVEWLKV